MSYAYQTPRLPPLLTFADFLDWPGDGLGTRYELVDGVLRAMAPGSDTHNTIVTNLTFLIEGHLRRRRPGCRVATAPGVRPLTRANWNFRIPDLGVTCRPNRSGETLLPDPLLLVEVLSPSNAADTWENVRAYATLPTLAEILIVHSTQVLAEVLVRGADGNWPADPTPVGPGETLRLASVDAVWPIEEVYHNTHLLRPDEATS
jgi:Uma2 family endonuclease